MDLLFNVCDKDIIENQSEYKSFIASLRKKYDKNIYKKYFIININLDEFDMNLIKY